MEYARRSGFETGIGDLSVAKDPEKMDNKKK